MEIRLRYDIDIGTIRGGILIYVIKMLKGSGWGTHVYLWRIHFDICQN